MNRLLLASLVSAVIVYVGLYLYDSSTDPRLYTILAGAFAAGFIVGIVHMLIDRRLTEWTPTAVAIAYIITAMAALFGLLFWNRQFGLVRPGVSQAWLDVVIACAAIGLPLWFLSIGRYRWNRWRGQDAIRPSDEFDAGAWRKGMPDRRMEYRRAEDREIRGITLSG
jgi:MFS family permease